MASRLEGDTHCTGRITAESMGIPANSLDNAGVKSDAAIARSKLAQDTLKAFDVKLTDFRVWDAMQTPLPGTSATDDLGLYGNTFATASPLVRTYDVKAAGAQTLRARVLIPLPIEYDAGETVTLRLFSGMITTIADVSATIDVEAYESGGDTTISADLCTTAAQSINSLTFANKDFTITPAGLTGGDLLDVRVTIAVNDAATVGAVIAGFGKAQLLADVRG